MAIKVLVILEQFFDRRVDVSFEDIDDLFLRIVYDFTPRLLKVLNKE